MNRWDALLIFCLPGPPGFLGFQDAFDKALPGTLRRRAEPAPSVCASAVLPPRRSRRAHCQRKARPCVRTIANKGTTFTKESSCPDRRTAHRSTAKCLSGRDKLS